MATLKGLAASLKKRLSTALPGPSQGQQDMMAGLGRTAQSFATNFRTGAKDLVQGNLKTIAAAPGFISSYARGDNQGATKYLQQARQGGNQAFGSEIGPQGFKFTGTGAPRVAVTGLAALAGPAAAIGSSAFGGALGGGFAALQRKDIATGIGEGAAQGLRSAGVNKLFSPVVRPLSQVVGNAAQLSQGGSKIATQLAANKLGTFAGRVGLTGAANVLENEIDTRTYQNRGQGPGEALMSFILGSGLETPGALKDLNLDNGYLRNKAGQLFDPETGRWVKATKAIAQKQEQFAAKLINVQPTPDRPMGGMKSIQLAKSRLKPGEVPVNNSLAKSRITQGGYVSLGGKFDGNYQRGDISTIQKRLDEILGTKSFNMTGNWKAELPARKLAKQQLEHYASQGEPEAIKLLDEVNFLEGQFADAQIAKTNGTQSPGLAPLADQTTTNKLQTPQQTSKEQLTLRDELEPVSSKEIAQSQISSLGGQKLLETKSKSLVGQSQPYFNSKNYNVEPKARKLIDEAVSSVKPAMEKVVGKKLSNQEVIQKADATARVFTQAVDRNSTEAWEAALLKTRQKLAALSQEGKVDQEYLETLVTLKSLGTDIGRKLQSFGIGADPKLVTSKQMILEAVTKVEKDTDKILKAAEGVDFNDLNQATTFYRKFVKPGREEHLDLLRYNSMLSSPNTHINNAFSNYQGTGIIAPIEKTIAGGVDALRSVLNGKPRTKFAGEGMAYAKAYYSNFDKAFTAFSDVLKGKSLTNTPDMRNIPLYPSGRLRKYENILAAPMKLLEASDQFFTALTKAGVEGSLNYRQGRTAFKGMDIESMADDEAARRLFRSELGENNGSLTLNALDIVANKVQSLKGSENPIIRTISKYSLPFLRTPTNILKQGVEYSPFGLTTLPGAKDKTEQLSKAILGSSIGLGTALLVGGDRMTWAEPTGEKQKQAFKAAGLQPYSIKIGDKWISYSKMHPAISFNLALVAAIRNAEENKTLDDGQIETVLNGAAKWVNFFADQSYVKNIGDLVSASKGDVEGLAKIPANYVQQFVPFRALMGWVSRLTDPYQRQVDPDGSFMEKQLGYLATQIPLLSQTVPARLDQFDNPIENQNRMLNAVSPLKVTTENPTAKEDYDFLKEKAKFEKDKRYMKSQLKNEAETVITTPQANASDSEYVAGTGLRKLSEMEKDKVDTYLEFGKAVSKEDLENRYLGQVSEMPNTNRYEKSLRDSELYSTFGTISKDENLSPEQKKVLTNRLATELGKTPDDLDYYSIAKQGNDPKTMYLLDELDTVTDKNERLDLLTAGRKPVNGQMIVSDGVIDNLVDEGILSEAEGKALKKVDFNEDGSQKTSSNKGRKITVKGAVSTPKVNIKLSRMSVGKSSPKLKGIKLSLPNKTVKTNLASPVSSGGLLRISQTQPKKITYNKIKVKSA